MSKLRVFLRNHHADKSWALDRQGNIDFYGSFDGLDGCFYLLMRKEAPLAKARSWPKSNQFTRIKPNYPNFRWMKKR